MRLFVGFNFPEYVLKEIKKIQDKLPDFSGKSIKPENLHLTLKFLGEIDEKKIQEIKERLSKVNAYKINAEINSIGFFSKKFLRIVWLHVSNCSNLQKEIDLSLEGLFEKEKRFMSHVTIARVKSISDKDSFIRKIEILRIKKISFKVENFFLVESKLSPEGPEYRIIEKYNLR